jgi:hypothetical protein
MKKWITYVCSLGTHVGSKKIVSFIEVRSIGLCRLMDFGIGLGVLQSDKAGR